MIWLKVEMTMQHLLKTYDINIIEIGHMTGSNIGRDL